jgi:mRNA interferase RelE/StbE
MTYKVRFSDLARKQWNKLGATVRIQFEAILRRRITDPHVPKARLKGASNTYKIKLRGSGYRLVYRVFDQHLVIYVVGLGRRDEVYSEMVDIGRISLSDLD